MTRTLKYFQAVREALDLCMGKDPAVYTIGLGVPDPKGVFGTTLGLAEKYGPARVLDMPASENAMAGIVLGSALVGLRPVMSHQRVDFCLLSLDQLVNQAANWRYMFGGRHRAPLVIRMVVGRGWGQGPQHSQSLQAWFAHVPGLKVVMPTTPHDAKGLLISAIEDDNPVVFLEHRWLHGISGAVPEGVYHVPLGEANVSRAGTDLTIVSTSHMTLEALRAAQRLEGDGVSAEVIDLRTVKPLDLPMILSSVRKTGRLIVADTGWKSFGVGAEIVAAVAEEAWETLRCPPRRIALPDCPTPTSPAFARHYYPGAAEIASLARNMLSLPESSASEPEAGHRWDVPDPTFLGPF